MYKKPQISHFGVYIHNKLCNNNYMKVGRVVNGVNVFKVTQNIWEKVKALIYINLIDKDGYYSIILNNN
jgi:hypothetical protein